MTIFSPQLSDGKNYETFRSQSPTVDGLKLMQPHHIIRRLQRQWALMGFGSTTLPHQRVLSDKRGAPVSRQRASQQHELTCSLTKTNRLIKVEQHVTWEAAEHPFRIYRCGPAALMMEGTEGVLSPDRLICCPTSNTTFDLVWFLLTKALCLPAATILDHTTDSAPKSGACVTKYHTSILETLALCDICDKYAQDYSHTIIQKVAETPRADQTNEGKPQQTNKQTNKPHTTISF